MHTCTHIHTCIHVQELKKHNATILVRCCDPSYDLDPLRKEGISVLVSNLAKLQHLVYVHALEGRKKQARRSTCTCIHMNVIAVQLQSQCVPLCTSLPTSVQSVNRTSRLRMGQPHQLSWCGAGWIWWERRSKRIQRTASQSTVWPVWAGVCGGGGCSSLTIDMTSLVL